MGEQTCPACSGRSPVPTSARTGLHKRKGVEPWDPGALRSKGERGVTDNEDLPPPSLLQEPKVQEGKFRQGRNVGLEKGQEAGVEIVTAGVIDTTAADLVHVSVCEYA